MTQHIEYQNDLAIIHFSGDVDEASCAIDAPTIDGALRTYAKEHPQFLLACILDLTQVKHVTTPAFRLISETRQTLKNANGLTHGGDPFVGLAVPKRPDVSGIFDLIDIKQGYCYVFGETVEDAIVQLRQRRT